MDNMRVELYTWRRLKYCVYASDEMDARANLVFDPSFGPYVRALAAGVLSSGFVHFHWSNRICLAVSGGA